MPRHPFVQHFISNKESDGKGIADNEIDTTITCLSNNVSKLLKMFEEQNVTSLSLNQMIDSESELLLWPVLEANVPQDHYESCRFLQKICRTLSLTNMQSLSLVEKHEKLLLSMRQPYHMLRNLLQQDDDYLIFSCLSTITERLIASIFLTVNNRNRSNKMLPNTLSDILESEEIKECLSEKCVHIISILIGPPSMLNLRNILWHGFCNHEELEHYYVSFLVRLYLSICDVVQKNLVEGEIFILKPQITLTISIEEADILKGKREDIDEPRCSGLRKLLARWNTVHYPPDFLGSCKYLIDNSYFNVPHRQSLIMSAFEHYYKAVQNPSSEDAQSHLFYSLCMFFPQFEHALRRVFVAVNPEVPDRLLCAESQELFSTLDLILCNRIAVPNDRRFIRNRLGIELGTSLCDALFDAFIHYSGPRLRDKIAHCEASRLEPKLVLHYLSLYLALCDRYRHKNGSIETIGNPTVSSLVHKFSQEEYPASLFDCRTLFINNWNQFVDDVIPRFISKYGNRESSYIRWNMQEVTEYECRFDIIKGVFIYGKPKVSSEPVNPKEIVEYVRNLSSKENKLGKNTLVFTLTSSELESVMLEAYGTINIYRLENTQYKNHYYILEQQVSNVNICGRIIRYHLCDALSVMTEKIDSLNRLIEERKARSAQRKGYGAFVNLMNLFILSVRIVGSMVLQEYTAMDQGDEDEQFYKQKLTSLLSILTQVERLHEATKAGTIGNFLASFTKYLIVE